MIKLKNKLIYFKASLAIESSLSMSLFVFFVCILLGPFIIIRNNSKILNELNNYVSKNVNNYISNKNEIKSALNKDKFLSEINCILDDNVSLSAQTFPLYKMGDDTIDFCYSLNDNIFDEETKLIEYDIMVVHKLPFKSIFPLNVSQRIISSKRAFVGASPARWNNMSDINNMGDVVYISKNSSYSKIYHINQNCSYLRHNLEKLTEKEALSKYKLCSYCKNKNQNLKEDYVYRTEDGDNYHYIDTCPLIYAYIEKVFKDSIPDYNPCSRCSK